MKLALLRYRLAWARRREAKAKIRRLYCEITVAMEELNLQVAELRETLDTYAQCDTVIP